MPKISLSTYQFIKDNSLSYLEGRVIELITHHKENGGKLALDQIKHYVDLIIDLEYPNKNDTDQEKKFPING